MRSYKQELKETVISLFYTGRGLKELSREYDIPGSTIRTWIKRHEEKHGIGVVSAGNLTKEELEIKRLKKELANVSIERDILKKAVSIFSKSDR